MSICNLIHLYIVSDIFHSIFETVPECGIARPIDELMLVQEEPLAAALTVVAAYIVGPPVLSSECPLHALALGDIILMRSQLLLLFLKIALPILLFPILIVCQRAELMLAWLRVLFILFRHDIVTRYCAV